MAKSNTFISYHGGVTISPPTPAVAIVLKEITASDSTRTESLLPWQADGNLYPTRMARVAAMRTLTIHSGDVAGMRSIPLGTVCTIVATLYDSVNGSGSGALTETWINAVVADVPVSGPTNQFAGGTITFMCFSSDGTTDPYSYTQAP